MPRKTVVKTRCALCGAKDVSEPRGEEKYCRDCWDKKIAVEEVVARDFALKRYIRAHSAFDATLVGVSFVSALVIAQTPAAPPMTSVLAGKKLTPPIRGQAEVDYTKPVTKREKDMVITRIQVKNTSNAPIPRLTITETWYDAGGTTVGGGKGA